ncbi:MAG: glycosyltransferase family 1 protein [Magnetococcales bacterium]|nr:glycosyltransferase family 1 protein [Magnetococcales bacterium]
MKKLNIAIVYDKNQPYTTGVYCKNAFESLGHIVTFYDINKRVVRKYDYVIKIDDGEPKGFKCMPWHKKIFWAIDTHTNFERLNKIAQDADYVFCCQKNGVDLFAMEGISATWLPLAGFIETPQYALNQPYDVAFVGGVDTDKRKLLKAKLEKLPIKMFFGNAKREDIAPKYTGTTIGLNTHVNNDINMRTYEVTINGALLIMERVVDNGMESIFIENKEYLAYTNTDELCQIIENVMKNPEKYQKIREAGHKRAIAEHTYTHRMEKMLFDVEEI